MLRHGSASHLRAPSANTTFTEYFIPDVILFVIAVTSLVLIVVFIAVYKLLKRNWSVKYKLS